MTAAPSQKTVVQIMDGRTYGHPELTPEDRAQQELPPEIGRIFIEDITASSAILALRADSNRDQILVAYGADIKALSARSEEADAFMFAVLDCAMTRFEGIAAKDESTALRKLLEPLGINPQIELTADRLALPPGELYHWLKHAFQAEADRIARRVVATLHLLADHQIVGLVDWKTADICMFHYFTWGSTKETLAVSRAHTGDNMGWNTIITTTKERHSLWRTRHTHHVVGAGVHMISDYKRGMPERVQTLLSRTPAWLKKHLLVIDGQETLTESVTEIAGQTTTESSHSVMRYDPALALGSFVFAGWSEDDVATTPAVPYPETRAEAFRALLITAVVVIMFGGGIYYAIRTSERAAMRKHEDYISQSFGANHFTKAGEAVDLPNGYKLIYNGYGAMKNRLRFTAPTYSNERTTWSHEVASDFTMTENGKERYGDVDFRPIYNLPYVLHVTHSSPEQIQYSVSWEADPEK